MEAFIRNTFVCVIFCLFGLSIAPVNVSAQSATATYTVYVPLASTSAQVTAPNTSIQQRVIDLINAERHANGCNVDLQLSSQLTDAAYGHSQDMAVNNYFSHTGSDGSTMADRVQATGYSYSWLAENIAAGYSTPEDVVAGWMNSAGHRKNILNCNLKETGVGYYYESNDQANVRSDSGQMSGPYRYYWTEDFGAPSQ